MRPEMAPLAGAGYGVR